MRGATPISFVAHSSLISPGTTVLTAAQTFELGQALAAIHQRFSVVYGPGDSAYDHTPDEQISLEEYAQAVQALSAALKTLTH